MYVGVKLPQKLSEIPGDFAVDHRRKKLTGSWPAARRDAISPTNCPVKGYAASGAVVAMLVLQQASAQMLGKFELTAIVKIVLTLGQDRV